MAPLLVGMLVAAFLIGIALAATKENQRRREALEAAARRLEGRIEESFWSGKSLHFEVDGVRAELTYFGGTDKAPPWTKIHFDWPGRSLRVAPEKTWASIKKFFGAQDIQLGDRRFDEAFLIQGEEGWAREALTPETRQLLWRLYELGAPGGFFGRPKGIYLDVTPAGVQLKCFRNHVRERARLLTFIETSLQVLAALKRAQGGGVSISVAEVVKAGKCPVCSDDQGELSKRCRGCSSAYHRECWDYLGGCAIFGCEDRYRGDRPRQKSW